MEILHRNKDNQIYFKCQYCGVIYTKNATRQKRHLEEYCLKCSQTVKDLLRKEKSEPLLDIDDKWNGNGLDVDTVRFNKKIAASASGCVNNNVTSAHGHNSNTQSKEENGNDSTSTIKKSQHHKPLQERKGTFRNDKRFFNLKTYIDSMRPDEQESLDEKLARAIFSSDCVLPVLENRYWIDFFQELRPSWKLPSAYKIGNPLLNAEHDRIELAVNEAIAKSGAIGIQCDGWSDIRNNSIVNFVVTTPETFLYKTKDTKGESHTGEYMMGL
ncbi:uncharacterized protein LOC105700205 isoform X3 [Orussus abietinus]|uniref:uncharacterized protein LOC105700205 isoform X3 n=1 Tax=Orussus abietinus TaxID=222816 RepID=UPI0006251055|nr:uncharacterized protein LOC105700205 isoform X3 [Orussus abietinus]